MEMEHINENTIRVLIENSDLAERGITFLDLLGNYKQIEKFFYSILEEVDVEKEFIETDAITFQVMPNQRGIELFISKSDQDGENSFDITQFMQPYLQNQENDGEAEDISEDVTEIEEMLASSNNMLKDWVVQVNDFEDLLLLAKSYYLQSGYTQLFWYENAYYLHISFSTEDMPDDIIRLDEVFTLEFGEDTSHTSAYLKEHGKLLIENDALETLRYYFK